MKKFIEIMLFFTAAIFPTFSMAYSEYYSCRVTGFTNAWYDTSNAEWLLDRYIEEQIFVDRSTGEVTHFGLGNRYYNQIDMIHSGGGGNHFKVIARSNNGWQAHYMVVEDSPAREKRFVIVTGGNVWRGLCR